MVHIVYVLWSLLARRRRDQHSFVIDLHIPGSLPEKVRGTGRVNLDNSPLGEQRLKCAPHTDEPGTAISLGEELLDEPQHLCQAHLRSDRDLLLVGRMLRAHP